MTNPAMLAKLERITVATERVPVILERIAAALETTSPASTVITATQIRAAKRIALLPLAQELGVTEAADKQGIDLSSCSNTWIRSRCLEAHAGEDFDPTG